VAVEARPSSRTTSRRRTWIGIAAFFILFTATTLYYLVPLSHPCGNTIPGGPGDTTTGGVWMAWQYSQTHGLPWHHTTGVSGAPFGERLWEPQFDTMLLVLSPMWVLSKFASPTCTFNLLMVGGFLLSGVAMFGLVRWLTRSMWASAFAAFAFSFSPYRMYKSTAHLDYVHAEFLIVMLLASFLVWQRPTRGRIAFLALAVAAPGYADGYYILIGLVGFAAINAAGLLYARLAERWSWGELWGRVRGVLIGGVGGAILLVPLGVMFLTQRAELSSQLLRAPTDAITFGSRPWYFLFPPRTHPFLPARVGLMEDRHLAAGSNYSETSLYIGWLIILLVAFLAVRLVVSHRARVEPMGATVEDRPPRPRGLSTGMAATMLGATALAAFVMSLPAEIHFRSLSFPAPSKFVFQLVTFFRVYARFFILMHAALVALAAIALAAILRRRSWPVQALATVLAIAIVAFEFLTFPPRGWYDYDAAPSVYRFVAAQRDADIVAEYPLYSWADQLNRDYLTYQPVHGKKLLNARVTGSLADGVDRTLFGLGDAGTAPVLRALGVKLVIVHPDMQGVGKGPAPADYELVQSFRYDKDQQGPHGKRVAKLAAFKSFYDADVYRVRPGPVSDVALREGTGFYTSEADGWNSFRWIRGTARLDLVPLASFARQATVSLTAHTAFDQDRELVVTQGGVELWRGTVHGPVEAGTDVRFTATVGQPVVFRTTPGDEPFAQHNLPADPRSVALRVDELTVVPG